MMVEAREWVRNPITGEKEYIQDKWVADRDTRCPRCYVVNPSGTVLLIVTAYHVIYHCPSCKMYNWCEIVIENER